MKKIGSIIIVLLLVISMVAACGDGDAGKTGQSKDAVTITITYATGDELTAELIRARIVEFQALNEHVTIIEKLSNEGAYLDAIRTLDAVGEFPDIVEMRDTPLFVRAGKLGELPADITSMFESTIAFDGKIYTAPLTETYPAGIIYNKKIFNNLGIDVTSIKTYNDFLNVCQKILDSGTAPLVVGGADIWHIGFWWSFFWHNNVSVATPDWLAKRYVDEVSFTDANVKAAMEGLTDLFNRGYVERGWASTAESMAPSILVTEQAAMYYIGPFVFQQIEEADPNFEYGFFALPNAQGQINVLGGTTPAGWAINSETQANDPAKTEAVYDFIRFFFEKDRYTDYVQQLRAVPSLKEPITYDASEQFQEVLRIAATADNRQLNWNQHIGPNELPPGFRNFCYSLTAEWFLGVSTIADGLVIIDEEWANLTREFNPVLRPE